MLYKRTVAGIMPGAVGEMKAELEKDAIIRDLEQWGCRVVGSKRGVGGLPSVCSLETSRKNGSPVLDAELTQAGTIISHFVS